MDPRIERTRTAVMDACQGLLLDDGPAALTMDAVVARSGVAKSTLYRHWPCREDLLADFFSRCSPDVPPPRDDLPFEVALRQQMGDVAAALADESWRRLLPALMTLEHDQPHLAESYQQVKDDQQATLARLLARGVEEGVVAARALDEVPLALALLVGPLFMNAISGDPVIDGISDRCVDQFLAGYQA